MQSGLSWAQARELTASGSRVRRAGWDDRYLFRSAGGLFWIADYAATYVRVVRAADFLRAEFLSNDWTNVDPDQGPCVGLLPIAASLSLSPSAILELGTTTAMLLLSEMSDRDRLFTVSAHPSGMVSHDASVTVAAGTISVDFVVTALDVAQPSGVILSATNPVYATAQASLAIGPYVAPPAPVLVRVANGVKGGPGDYFRQTVTNPFSAPARVSISGVVDDGLLINGVLVFMGTGGGFPQQTLTLPAGGSFTIAVRNRPFSGENYASIDAEIWFYIQ